MRKVLYILADIVCSVAILGFTVWVWVNLGVVVGIVAGAVIWTAFISRVLGWLQSHRESHEGQETEEQLYLDAVHEKKGWHQL